MKTKKLQLYTLDMKYVRNLSKVDDNVFSVSPQEHKEKRPFVGIVVICNNKEYCIPLTSPKEKHYSMKNDIDFSRIIDKKGKLIGALNFNNMIPVTKDVIKKINVEPDKNDTVKDKIYKDLLNDQLDWCNDNNDIINRKANKLYNFVTLTPEKSRALVRRCGDFKRFEKILEKYLIDNNFKKANDGFIIKIVSDKQYETLKNSDIPFKTAVKDGQRAVQFKAELKEKVEAVLNVPKLKR